jgi:hypothetical protein
MLEIAEKWRTMAAFEEKFARYGGPGMAALPAHVGNSQCAWRGRLGLMAHHFIDVYGEFVFSVSLFL